METWSVAQCSTRDETERKELEPTVQKLKRLEAFSLLDVESVRLMLLGSSVIDWLHLQFTQRDEVDAFLRLCRFDPDAASDQAWMREILQGAVQYLKTNFKCRIPPEVAKPAEIHDVFLIASGPLGTSARKMACMVLKACHVIHHIEARDLFHRLPLAEEAFGEMARAQVTRTFDDMAAADFPIRSASSSVKTRASLISKLLLKADTLAAQIYDRTRFRVVVAERSDVLPVLQWLTQQLFPFHLVLPGQTQNSLIDFRATCEATPAWKPMLGALQFGVNFLGGAFTAADGNEFSGASYRTLKLVVDMPLRIEEHFITPEIASATRARTVCCLVEIQIVDATTNANNELGENDHRQYKERQRLLVLHRLSRGLAASFTRVQGKDLPEEP